MGLHSHSAFDEVVFHENGLAILDEALHIIGQIDDEKVNSLKVSICLPQC
jgi:hypothetical protein